MSAEAKNADALTISRRRDCAANAEQGNGGRNEERDIGERLISQTVALRTRAAEPSSRGKAAPQFTVRRGLFTIPAERWRRLKALALLTPRAAAAARHQILARAQTSNSGRRAWPARSSSAAAGNPAQAPAVAAAAVVRRPIGRTHNGAQDRAVAARAWSGGWIRQA